MLTRHRTSHLTTLGGLLLLAAVAACDDRALPTATPSLGRPTFQVATAPVVNSLADDGDGTCTDAKCTLRDAIAFASGAPEITFSVTGTVTLAQGQLSIGKNLTITGPGAASLTVSGNNASRVFSVAAGFTVSVSGLTITGGSQSGLNENGGGIYNLGTLTLTQVIVSGNSAAQGSGGGIYSQNGSVTIEQSTVSGNSALTGGGIYYLAGSINVFLTVTHSTVSGNAATGRGHSGGIYSSTQYNMVAEPPVPVGGTIIENSTISGNTAYNYAGIFNSSGLTRIDHSTITGNQATSFAGGLAATTYFGVRTSVRGSLIWGNTANGVASDVAGIDIGPAGWRYESLGYNLIGAAAGTVDFTQDFTQSGDQTAVVNARIGALASNGGPTKTHALQSASPAINAGTCTDYSGATITDDQRGVTRPQGSVCDIGAFELSGGTTTPSFTFNLSELPAKTYGNGTFNVAGYASTNSTGAITFATVTGSVGCSVTGEGLVTITGAATGTSYCVIEATLAPDATYSAAGPISQSFNIAKAALTVTANNVTITYGGTPSFSVNHGAFVGSDNASSLGGTLVYTFEGISPTSYGPSTTAPTNAGTYSITPGGLSSSNYSFTYVSGTFTINKAEGSVSINNLPSSGTVGGSFTPTYDKLGDGTASTASTTLSVCTVSGGVVSYIAEGTCTLVASVTEGTNYLAATDTPQGFTIGPSTVFSSTCTYATNPKNGQYETTVNWANATPGVTLIQVVGSRTIEKRMAPTASGTWSTKVSGAAPEYQLFGGTGRRNSGTELTARTACTAP